jgi:hypothetical protein
MYSKNVLQPVWGEGGLNMLFYPLRVKYIEQVCVES